MFGRLPGRQVDSITCLAGRRVAGSPGRRVILCLVGCRVAMKGILHDKIGQLLDKFTYRHRYGLSNGDVYHKLVYDIARLNNSTDNQK